jgi:hypothetical protein
MINPYFCNLVSHKATVKSTQWDARHRVIITEVGRAKLNLLQETVHNKTLNYSDVTIDQTCVNFSCFYCCKKWQVMLYGVPTARQFMLLGETVNKMVVG